MAHPKRTGKLVTPINRKPAINGGRSLIQDRVEPFLTIGGLELLAVTQQLCSAGPLSGYLGGVYKGGTFVESLEEKWCRAFRCEHAIAMNSATSGLLAAAAVIDLRPGDEFIVSPFTMSATAACGAFLGAIPVFADIEGDTFGLDPLKVRERITKATRAIFVTNLFGHPAHLTSLRELAHEHKLFLIEDNAQSPFAMELDQFAGTIGDIGVFSLNVHKHLQCGEGGVVVTNNDTLAQRLAEFRNHGEMFQDGRIGLNLRMTEPIAAIALAQLERAEEIITDRIEQAHMFMNGLDDILGITPPVIRKGCKHVYYVVPLKYDPAIVGLSRQRFMQALNHEFLFEGHREHCPIGQGYVKPLYHLPAFKDSFHECPVAEDMHNNKLIFFENCGYTPNPRQLGLMAKAIGKIVDAGIDGDLKDD